MTSTLVIADLHLSPERPDITACFKAFMSQELSKHSALYIIGDLFEAWVGDDDDSDFATDIASIIKQFSQDSPVYFIHGNRDFLLKEKYAQRCGMQLLPEQYITHIDNKKVIFLHGDTLCTADKAYQQFRKKSRSWWWQSIMLCLPLSFRKKKAAEYRARSKLAQQNLSMEIMDVTPEAVIECLHSSQADWLIHGHTHRPNIHNLEQNKKRIVVGDWYEQGSVLRISNGDLRLQSLPFINTQCS